MYKKKDSCTIVSTNVGKNLVYQIISFVMEGLVLVILPKIAIIED